MNLRTLGKAVVASLLATIAAVGICSADGIIIPEPPPDVPIEEISDLAIKYHRVQVEIRDQVATTRIDQVFLNDMPYDLEGTYIFPLPEEAAISEFAMYVDGERLEGQILDKDQARRIADLKALAIDSILDLRWSPDGRRLAFSSYNYATGKPGPIFVISAEGGEITRLATDDSGEKDYLYWSSDGKWISYNSDGMVKTRPEGAIWEADVSELLSAGESEQ